MLLAVPSVVPALLPVVVRLVFLTVVQPGPLPPPWSLTVLVGDSTPSVVLTLVWVVTVVAMVVMVVMVVVVKALVVVPMLRFLGFGPSRKRRWRTTSGPSLNSVLP